MRIELKVDGNANFYLDEKTPRWVAYSINANLEVGKPPENVQFQTPVGIFNIGYSNFQNLIDNLKGCQQEQVAAILGMEGVSINFTPQTTIQEFDIVKALFELYDWLKFRFTEYWGDILNDTTIGKPNPFAPRIFDEVVASLPTRLRAGPVQDIYLIKEEYQNIFSEQINNLMEINLLSKVTLKTEIEREVSYFIPFSKPAYKPALYKTEETHRFFRKILNDRHLILSKTISR